MTEDSGNSFGPADGPERPLQVVRRLARGPPVQQMLARQVLQRRLPAPGLGESVSSHCITKEQVRRKGLSEEL